MIFSMNVSLDGYADHTVAIADDELHESCSSCRKAPTLRQEMLSLKHLMWEEIKNY